MFDIRIGKTAATLKASTRRAVATMFFLLLTSLGGTSAALAACQTSADFTGAVLNSVVSLDVSTCAANIRAGLYTGRRRCSLRPFQRTAPQPFPPTISN
jgi:hypothetical protein